MIEIVDRVVISEPEEKHIQPNGLEIPKTDPLDEVLSRGMVDEGCPNLLPDE